MKLYTGNGDKGKTDLGDGRESKNCPDIEALGVVDELNSHIGYARSLLEIKEMDIILKDVQQKLHAVQSELSGYGQKEIKEDDVAQLEEEIDKLTDKVGSLDSFILAGGCPAGSFLQVCRSVARRAERKVIGFKEEKNRTLNSHTTAYLNRLSDLLFVAARFVNQENGADEEPVSY